MRQVALKLSDGFYNSIKTESKRTNRTVSQYIRDILLTSKHPFVQERDNNVNTNDTQQ